MLSGKTVLLGVSSSIACYKIASLASSLKKMGADVHVIMTKNATKFITPMTFETLTGNKCLVDTFDRDFEFDVKHISLAKAADILMVAPATANVIAKMATGIADDMLTTTALACRCPKMAAPAMNTAMFENPVTQDNIGTLKSYGWEIIEPVSGLLACNDTGQGKMVEPEILEEYILREIALEKDLAGERVLVTAGPTQEAIDPVRYITNHSTGKMGYALARACMMRGAEVTLVTGHTALQPPMFINVVNIESAADMYEAVISAFPETDYVFKAAAVADYTPSEKHDEKIKKKDGDMTIHMDRTKDILAELGKTKRADQFVCGFSMETQNMLENSTKKLEKKNTDMIVANSLRTADAGFGTDTNVVTIITREGAEELPKMSKFDVANAIIDRALGK